MKKQFILIIAAVGCLLTASYAVADNQPTDDIYATDKTPTLTKEQKKAEKARKKTRKKKIKDSISFELAKKAVEEGRFVITADQIRGKHGRTVNVNRTTNFVLVQGDTAVVQFALEGIVNSPNGIGGLTVEGRVTKKTHRLRQTRKSELHDVCDRHCPFRRRDVHSAQRLNPLQRYRKLKFQQRPADILR